MRAYLLIECDTGKTKAVQNSLSKIPGVKESHIIMGPYDLIAYVEGKTIDSIGSIAAIKVSRIKGIKRTLTCLVADL